MCPNEELAYPVDRAAAEPAEVAEEMTEGPMSISDSPGGTGQEELGVGPVEDQEAVLGNNEEDETEENEGPGGRLPVVSEGTDAGSGGSGGVV